MDALFDQRLLPADDGDVGWAPRGGMTLTWVVRVFLIAPMLYEPKVMVANVRGLNDRVRRTGVRSVVGTTGASIVCLQETKLSVVTPAIVMEALGADFDAYFCLPTSGTRGGVIVA
jgi:hypothetical protein